MDGLMNYYKDQLTGEVYAYDDRQVEGGAVKPGLTLMTTIEVAAHLNPPPTQAQLAALERTWRDAELLKADIEVNKAADTGSATEPAWRQYRQALRNWPQSAEFPAQSCRPTPPAGDQA